MIRISICDDDFKFSNYLKNYIKKKIKLNIKIDIYTTPFELIERINNYDVLFLDYDLPYIDGITVLDKLKDFPIIKIMVSNYSHICFNTYQYKLFWFVRKQYLETDLEMLIPYLENELYNNIIKFTIKSANKYLTLEFNKINYIETKSNYLYIHTDHQKYQIRSSFGSIISQFKDYSFVIPIYGIIINLSYIEYINFHDSIIYLKNGEIIPISRSKKRGVKEAYGKYISRF